MTSSDKIVNGFIMSIMPAGKTRVGEVYDGKTGNKLRDNVFETEFQLYLINVTAPYIQKVIKWFGDPSEGPKNFKNMGPITTNEALLIDSLDFGELDFLCDYYLDVYSMEGEIIKITTTLSHVDLFPKKTIIPVLQRMGTRLEFNLREKAKLEKEKRYNNG